MQNLPNRREHTLVTLLLLFIFAAGAQARLRLPLAPFGDRDTWGYLFPSLSHFINGVFYHSYGREFPYPYFMDRVLFVFGTLNALSIVQHLLGLLTGVLLWVTWKRMGRFFPDTPRSLRSWVGVAIVASYLLSMGPIRMEHTIRPESIFPLVAVFALWCGTEFSVAFYQQDQRRRAAYWGMGLVASSVALLFIKGAFGLGALLAISPVLVSCFRPCVGWGYRFKVLVVPLALVGATLWYPEHVLSAKFDQLTKTFAQQHLFAFQARIIRKEIADELEGRRPLAYDREVVEHVASMMDQVFAAGNRHFPSLGFDADALIYRQSVVAYLTDYFQNDGERLRQFYMHYYWSAWRHHPLEMLAKIDWQMIDFYAIKSPFDNQNYSISISREAKRGAEMGLMLKQPLPLFDHYIASQQQERNVRQTWKQPVVILILNEAFAIIYRLCALGMPVTLGYLWWARRRPAREAMPWRTPTIWFLYVMGYGFFNTLTLAIGHTLDVRRYVQSQLSYSLLAAGCGVLLLAMLVRQGIAAIQERRATRLETAGAHGGQV